MANDDQSAPNLKGFQMPCTPLAMQIIFRTDPLISYEAVWSCGAVHPIFP